MNRREWMKCLGMTGLAASTGWLSENAWAAPLAQAYQANSDNRKKLLVVMLRGAVDGLSVVVPYADPGYYAARSSIALQTPGQPEGVLDLDGFFGLHPALDMLHPLWLQKRLAFVHASGSPSNSRSHFDAQDFMETATPDKKTTPDGWLNRLAGLVQNRAPGESGVENLFAVGSTLPRICAGPLSVGMLENGGRNLKPSNLDNPDVDRAFSQMYGGQDSLSKAFQQARATRKEVMQALNSDQGNALSAEMQAANNGAPPPKGFAADAALVAKLFRSEPRVQLAFMAVGGWDTHANQGAAKGQLANNLRLLGTGLSEFYNTMGTMMDDTVVVVMSEFGRTVRQNGNNGTDHGHGNVMWLMGGPVEGGRVHGQWPGLAPDALYEGRDLAVTTDFREVIVQICARHLGIRSEHTPRLLPGYTGSKGTAARYIKA